MVGEFGDEFSELCDVFGFAVDFVCYHFFAGEDLFPVFEFVVDGGKWIPGDKNYYGEVDFTVHYKGMQEDPIEWLYLDFETLKNACEHHGLQCKRLMKEEDSYLAKITLQ